MGPSPAPGPMGAERSMMLRALKRGALLILIAGTLGSCGAGGSNSQNVGADSGPPVYRFFSALSQAPRGIPGPLLERTERSLQRRSPERLEDNSARLLVNGIVGDIWIVAGRRAVCAVKADDGAFTCDTVASVKRHGLVLGLFEPLPESERGRKVKFMVFGLVPDTFARARLRVGRTNFEMAVRDNQYALSAAHPVRIVDYEAGATNDRG